MEPIGRVSSPRTEPVDDDWGEVVATITLDSSRFVADALRGLEGFSHLEVVYVFDRVLLERGGSRSAQAAGQHRLARGGHLRSAG